jgi:hypothetical protein
LVEKRGLSLVYFDPSLTQKVSASSCVVVTGKRDIVEVCVMGKWRNAWNGGFTLFSDVDGDARFVRFGRCGKMVVVRCTE